MRRLRFPSELTVADTEGIFRKQAAKPKEIKRETRKAVILFVDGFMVLIPFLNLIHHKLSSMIEGDLSRISVKILTGGL